MTAWRLPPTARIGYREYALKTWPRTDANCAGAVGIHEEYTQTIRVSDELVPNQAAAILLHEIMYACWRNVDTTGDIEEHAVSVLSENLAQVWRDNPAVVAFITKNLRAS